MASCWVTLLCLSPLHMERSAWEFQTPVRQWQPYRVIILHRFIFQVRFVTHYSAFVEDNTDVYKMIKQLENTDTETMGNHGSVIVHCRPWIGLWDYLHLHNSALSILQPFFFKPFFSIPRGDSQWKLFGNILDLYIIGQEWLGFYCF